MDLNNTVLWLGGQPLALDEIEKDLPTCSAKVLLASKWTFITLEVYFSRYLIAQWTYMLYLQTVINTDIRILLIAGTSILEQTMVQTTSMWY